MPGDVSLILCVGGPKAFWDNRLEEPPILHLDMEQGLCSNTKVLPSLNTSLCTVAYQTEATHWTSDENDAGSVDEIVSAPGHCSRDSTPIVDSIDEKGSMRPTGMILPE